jgi:hypothetical protein
MLIWTRRKFRCAIDDAWALKRRRAGIEPLIQHVKSFGLGRSRMKSDETALASGYRAVMGFNLHQLIRHMQSAAA